MPPCRDLVHSPGCLPDTELLFIQVIAKKENALTPKLVVKSCLLLPQGNTFGMMAQQQYMCFSVMIRRRVIISWPGRSRDALRFLCRPACQTQTTFATGRHQNKNSSLHNHQNLLVCLKYDKNKDRGKSNDEHGINKKKYHHL